jgi:hypothetical protein
MKRRLGNSLFWLITIGCALATCALVIPPHVSAVWVTSTCESAWGPHLGTCSCTCNAKYTFGPDVGAVIKFKGSARAKELSSGSSSGYTDTNAVTITPGPSAQTIYDGTQARTRINCTDTDINFAQIDSPWGPKYTTAHTISSSATCPTAAPIAYETFCKVKVTCKGNRQ